MRIKCLEGKTAGGAEHVKLSCYHQVFSQAQGVTNIMQKLLTAVRLTFVLLGLSGSQARQEGCIDGPSTKYRGTWSLTMNGIVCQRWDVRMPHDPKVVPLDGGHHNFCRNPDEDPRGTWCYTTNPGVRWSYCNIPQCECISHSSTLYRGFRNYTKSGSYCKPWKSIDPNDVRFTPGDGGEHNYCRNPDADMRGAWCYTSANNTFSDYCNIAYCENANESLVVWTYHDSAIGTGAISATSAIPELVKKEISETGRFKPSVLVKGATKIRALTADQKNKRVFFTDERANYLGVYAIDSNTTVQYLKGMVQSVQNIAYNQATGNLYWTDAARKWVMVSDRNFRYYVPVYRTKDGFPRGIAVDSTNRRLFFSIYQLYGSQIMTTDLTGKYPTILLRYPEVIDVTGMSIYNKRLYWADNDDNGASIKSCKLDGTGLTSHFNNQGSRFEGIATYAEFLYATDSAVSLDPETQVKRYTIWVIFLSKQIRKSIKYSVSGSPSGIAVFPGPFGQDAETEGPTDTESGFDDCTSELPCDHFCIPRANKKRKCMCSYGYTLTFQTDCHPDTITDEFIVVFDSSQNKAFQISLHHNSNRSAVVAIPLRDPIGQQVMATDVSRNLVYWSDRKSNRIMCIRLERGEYSEQRTLIEGRQASSLTVDPRTGNVYFVDKKTQSIFLVSYEGEYTTEVYMAFDPQLVTMRIGGIALDLINNQLYWTENYGLERPGSLWRALLDGSNEELVYGEMVAPSTVRIDHARKSILIAEDGQPVIYEMSLANLSNTNTPRKWTAHDLSDQRRRFIFNTQTMDVYDGLLLIVDERSSQIQQYNLSRGVDSVTPFGPNDFYNITSLAVFSKMNNDRIIGQISNSCSFQTTPCRHLCVPITNSFSKCICNKNSTTKEECSTPLDPEVDASTTMSTNLDTITSTQDIGIETQTSTGESDADAESATDEMTTKWTAEIVATPPASQVDTSSRETATTIWSNSTDSGSTFLSTQDSTEGDDIVTTVMPKSTELTMSAENIGNESQTSTVDNDGDAQSEGIKTTIGSTAEVFVASTTSQVDTSSQIVTTAGWTSSTPSALQSTQESTRQDATSSMSTHTQASRRMEIIGNETLLPIGVTDGDEEIVTKEMTVTSSVEAASRPETSGDITTTASKANSTSSISESLNTQDAPAMAIDVTPKLLTNIGTTASTEYTGIETQTSTGDSDADAQSETEETTTKSPAQVFVISAASQVDTPSRNITNTMPINSTSSRSALQGSPELSTQQTTTQNGRGTARTVKSGVITLVAATSVVFIVLRSI